MYIQEVLTVLISTVRWIEISKSTCKNCRLKSCRTGGHLQIPYVYLLTHQDAGKGTGENKSTRIRIKRDKIEIAMDLPSQIVSALNVLIIIITVSHKFNI